MTTTENETADVQRMSPFQNLALIFSSPEKVFANLKVYPSWLLPTLIVVLLAIAGGISVYDIQMKEQKQRIMKSEQLNDQQKETILNSMDESGAGNSKYIQTAAGAAVFIFLSYLLVSALFLFSGNFVFGGKASFKQVLAVYAWGSLVSIPETIIKIPMMLRKESLHVYTSLALLMDVKESESVTFKILNAFDVFSIWRIALWGIGLAVVYNFTKGKSTIIVVVWYIIYVALTVFLQSVMGGFFG